MAAANRWGPGVRETAGRIAPPPEWYRGGAKGFTDRVRRRTDLSESIPSLEFTPDRLGMAFRDAWVEEVLKVSYSPGKIRVHVKYRKPVAMVALADADTGVRIRRAKELGVVHFIGKRAGEETLERIVLAAGLLARPPREVRRPGPNGSAAPAGRGRGP